MLDYEATMFIYYSDVEGDVQSDLFSFGIIDVDPLFIGGSPFDYHLSQNSPCIDSGTDQNIPSTDRDGNPRKMGGEVDLGVYEYQGWPSVPRAYVNMPSHRFEPGDIAYCSATVWNPENHPLEHLNLFVILEYYGQFFCAPSFTSCDYFTWSFDPGENKINYFTRIHLAIDANI